MNEQEDRAVVDVEFTVISPDFKRGLLNALKDKDVVDAIMALIIESVEHGQLHARYFQWRAQ
jgi:hypothetical protein